MGLLITFLPVHVDVLSVKIGATIALKNLSTTLYLKAALSLPRTARSLGEYLPVMINSTPTSSRLLVQHNTTLYTTST